MGLLVQSVQPTVSFLTAESSKFGNVEKMVGKTTDGGEMKIA
jgi:hypothetical protein